jgi:oligoendopeptidase F
MKTSALAKSAIALASAVALMAGLPDAAQAAAPAAATAANPPAVWNLSAIYADDAAWEAARQKFVAGLPQLKTLQGTLATSPQTLLHAMDQISAAKRESMRLALYASLKADEDTRVAANQQRRQLADAATNQFGQATSFVASEVSAMGAAKVDAAIAAEPGLNKHAYFLHTLLRMANHTLSADGEALLAAADNPLEQPTAIYELLSNADLPWPKITVRGKTHTLDQETYVALRDDRDPKVREQVFKAFWPVYKAFERTIGAIYVAHLRGTVFTAHARKYDSSLDMAVSLDNTPTAVYRTLVAETNAGLPTLQRYLKTSTSRSPSPRAPTRSPRPRRSRSMP